MNQGTVPKTPAQIEQERIALEQLQQYYKTQLPALGYAIRTTQEGRAGEQEIAAGQAVQSSRVAANDAMKRSLVASPEGSRPGSSSFAARTAGILQAGAGAGSANEGTARLKANEDFYGAQKGIIKSGNAMMNMANRGLVTAGGIQADAAQQQAAATAQNQQELASLAIAALALI